MKRLVVAAAMTPILSGGVAALQNSVGMQ